MSTLTVTLTAICPGGNHLTFTISGDVSATFLEDLDDLSAPITQDDADTFIKIIARMAKAGRTVAQARAILQAGVTVTV